MATRGALTVDTFREAALPARPAAAGALAIRLMAAGAIVAFVVRLGMTIAFQGIAAPPNLSANPDQAEYEQITYNLTRGHGYSVNGITPTAVRPPGFALTIGPVYAMFGHSYLAARIAIVLLSSLTCVLAGWIAYQLGGWWAAVIATWWLALYPGHFYYSMHFLSEPIYAFWLAAALATTIAAGRSTRLSLSALAGLCWGFAVLTRVELLVVLPIAWGLILFEQKGERRRRARQWLVQTLVIGAMLTPWVVRNGVVMHEYTLSTQGGCTFWGSHNDVTFGTSRFAGTWVNCSELVDAAHPMTGNEIARNHLTMGYGVASAKAHASELPYLTVMKVWRLMSPFFETDNRTSLLAMAAGWIVTAPFVLFGFWSLWRVNVARRPIALTLISPLLATLATTVVFYGSTRYRDAAAPILVVIAAIGLMQMVGMATQYRWVNSPRKAD